MFSKLTDFEKKFISSNIILYSAGFIFESIFSFYLWEKTNDFVLVLIYNVVYFVSTFVGICISEIALQFIESKFIRAFGVITKIPYGLLILFIPEINTTTIIVLGIVYGLGVGIHSLPYPVLTRSRLLPEHRGRMSSIQSSIDKVKNILLPLVVTQIVALTGNYSFTFVAAVLLTVISIIPLVRIRGVDESKSRVNILETYKSIKDKTSILRYFLFAFFNGMNYGIKTAVFGIITLYILGGVGQWGIFNTIIIFLQILVSILIGRKLRLETSPLAFGTLSLLTTIGSLIFANNFVFLGLLVFNFLMVPYNALFDASSSIITEKVLDTNLLHEKYSDELMVVREFFLMLGRILPLGILIILKPSFENDLSLRAAVLLFGLTALLMFWSLSALKVVKRRNDPFLNA